ncbi:MAG TPA: SBBP repeat-containing protein [Syntrophobacter fumaroxidans]|nr:SBBP repeat-containing protein [Syntrophobacter fumaroxidans]
MKVKTLLSLFALLLSWMPASAFGELAGWTRGNVAIADGRGMGGAGTDPLPAETFSGAPEVGVMADAAMERGFVRVDPAPPAEGSGMARNAAGGGWVRKYPPQPRDVSAGASDVAVDGAGNVYITGGIGTGILTVKYDNAGKLRWARKFGSEANAFARHIAMDRSGNVYVGGCIGSYAAGTVDFLTIKYNSAGACQWARSYNGSGNGVDGIDGIAVDASGNVYVTGSSATAEFDTFRFATIKYSTNGKRLWVRRYEGSEIGWNRPRDIALDGSGNVYVTGFYDTDTGHYDVVTLKYDADGVLVWEKRYNDNPGQESDLGYALAVDGSGNVHVVATKALSEKSCYLTLKYDTDGNVQWIRRHCCTSDYPEADIALDPSGNVYVAGNSRGSDSHLYSFCLKYDASGVRQWIRNSHGPGGGDAMMSPMAVDGQGNVYVTGESEGLTTGMDFATVKYDTGGARQWTRRYNGTGNLDDRATSIALDAAGNAFVTGISYRTDAIFEAVTIKIPATAGRAAGK